MPLTWLFGYSHILHWWWCGYWTRFHSQTWVHITVHGRSGTQNINIHETYGVHCDVVWQCFVLYVFITSCTLLTDMMKCSHFRESDILTFVTSPFKSELETKRPRTSKTCFATYWQYCRVNWWGENPGMNIIKRIVHINHHTSHWMDENSFLAKSKSNDKSGHEPWTYLWLCQNSRT